MSKVNLSILFGVVGLALSVTGLVAADSRWPGAPAYLGGSMVFMFLTARCLDLDRDEALAAKKKQEKPGEGSGPQGGG